MSERPTALITGASGGLGAEIARVLAQEGFDLLLVARSEGKLQALADELRATHGIEVQTFPCDLSREDAALDVYDYVLGRGMRVDALVNNAGFGDSGAFHEADWTRQRDMVQVNVMALMQLTRLLVPPKTVYSLTELGQTLVPLIKGMCDWGYAYFELAGVPAPCEGVNPFAEEA
jgi:short-subunit dehydrogenase